MRRGLGFAALAGFMLSLGVHSATIRGIDMYSRWPGVWVLHFVALILFGMFVLTAGYRIRFNEIFLRLPGWAVVSVVAVFLYAVVNCLVFAGFSGEGNAHVSEPDYHLHRAYELRFFSGVWAALFMVATVYFLLWRDNLDGTRHVR
jgi:hypothetical protein